MTNHLHRHLIASAFLSRVEYYNLLFNYMSAFKPWVTWRWGMCMSYITLHLQCLYWNTQHLQITSKCLLNLSQISRKYVMEAAHKSGRKMNFWIRWDKFKYCCCCCCCVASVVSDSVWPHRQQPTRLHCSWDSPGKNTGVGCHFLLQCMRVKSESEVAQSYPTLSSPIDCSPPGSSVHGIFQARVLEWGAIAFTI